MKKDEMNLVVEIAKRSESMIVGAGDRLTRIMDIEFAHEKFNLDLERFLKAEPFDFTHDFCGIQSHIDREKKVWTDDLFLPRFARKSE